jgi:hypothetical protein
MPLQFAAWMPGALPPPALRCEWRGDFSTKITKEQKNTKDRAAFAGTFAPTSEMQIATPRRDRHVSIKRSFFVIFALNSPLSAQRPVAMRAKPHPGRA